MGWVLFLMILDTFAPNWVALYLTAKVPAFGFGGIAITLSALVAVACGFFKSAWLLACLPIDLSAGGSVCVEGRVSTSLSTREGNGMDKLHGKREESHFYVVKNTYLPVTLLAYEARRPYSGSTFKVYMAPLSKLLLSLEPTKLKRA